MDRVLYDLKHTPYSRRIMTNTYVFSDLSEMHLYPCAYSVTYNVTQRPQDDKPTLNMILNQRSQDILAANNWNVCRPRTYRASAVCGAQGNAEPRRARFLCVYDR